MSGEGRVYQRGRKFWIAYYDKGAEVREPGGKTEAEARKRLNARRIQIEANEFVGLKNERVSVGELLDSLLKSLEIRGAKSLRSLTSHLKPVREYFGQRRAANLNSCEVEEFISARLNCGKARATVNRELQGLKQALLLAKKQKRLANVPHIPKLAEENARQGFFETDEFERVVAALPGVIADVARFAFASGWRKSEILGLRWVAVDRMAQEVRLQTSKNGHGRMLPLSGVLGEVVERRWSAREYSGLGGVIALSEHVFHSGGQPIVDFRKSWASACKKAGVPGKLFHDLRRTAVRNMIRAGVPQSVAMKITGHRGVSIFERYNITSDEDRRDALRRTQEFVSAPNGRSHIVRMDSVSQNGDTDKTRTMGEKEGAA